MHFSGRFALPFLFVFFRFRWLTELWLIVLVAAVFGAAVIQQPFIVAVMLVWFGVIAVTYGHASGHLCEAQTPVAADRAMARLVARLFEDAPPGTDGAVILNPDSNRERDELRAELNKLTGSKVVAFPKTKGDC